MDHYERFWSRFERTEGCWVWTGYRRPEPFNYGHLSYIPNGCTSRIASRIAWELEHGPLPGPHIKVLHRCDNPPCCNPSHLFLGTDADNTADKVAKGRCRGGENKKMTLDQAREVRSRVASGEQQKDLALEFGVSNNAIWQIIHNITYVDQLLLEVEHGRR